MTAVAGEGSNYIRGCAPRAGTVAAYHRDVCAICATGIQYRVRKFLSCSSNSPICVAAREALQRDLVQVLVLMSTSRGCKLAEVGATLRFSSSAMSQGSDATRGECRPKASVMIQPDH